MARGAGGSTNWNKVSKIYRLILNAKNPRTELKPAASADMERNPISYIKEQGYDSFIINNQSFKNNRPNEEVVVFEPEQIHILGSKADIQGFKEFVQGKQFQKLTAEEKAKTIEQLFNEDESLANSIYEALGFSKKLNFYKGDTLTIDEKIYSIVEKISSKELAKRNGLTISSNIPVYIVSEFLGSRKGGYDTVNNIIILSKDSDKETIYHELIHSVEYNLDKSELNPLYEKVKDSITEESFDGFVSWNFRKNISEFVADALSKKAFRNALKKEGLLEEVDNVLSVYTSDTTPQQKQQAQQLYSQYLDTIFPDSKVKDIVYHGTGEKFDIFDFKLVGKTTKGFANAAFFTNDKNWAFSRFALADTHQVWGKEGVVLSALINIKNPKIFDTVFDFNKSIEEGIYTNLNEELNEKLRDIFPPVKSGKIYFVVNLNKQLKPEFKFVDENQREEKYSELTGKYTVPKNITEQEYLNTLSKEEKNNFLIKKQKLNDIISSYSTDIDKAIKGLTTKTAALSGKEDSVIQTHPNTDTKEYAVFEPEQIHVLGSKTDIQGFKDFVQSKQFQKLTAEEKAKTIEQVTKEHRSITALKDLSAKLAHRIGGKVKFENNPNADWKGYNQGMTSVLNEAYMTPDTPFHEILAHPIIRAIKEGYHIPNYIESEIEITKKLINKEITKEQAKELRENRKVKTGNNKLYQSLLKELETGRGKEVFEQVKRDYVYKETLKDIFPKVDVFGISDELYEIDGKTFNSLVKAEEYQKNNPNKIPYTLEEQQEEAIVQIIGLYSAQKLDKLKDKTLIQLIKELLKEMSDFVKLIFKKEINITKDLDNISELTDTELNKLLKNGELTKKC